MKILKYFLIIFIFLNSPIKADSSKAMINELQKGGKLIFIRHAYAPGGGDPTNFDINICETQRNLNDEGRIQSKKINSSDKIDLALLKKLRIMNKRYKKLKILGKGEIKEKLNIEVNYLSSSAKTKLEKSGSNIKIINK